MGGTASSIENFVASVESLGPGQMRELAEQFCRSEASPVTATRRAMARHLALMPDSPGVIDTLSGQLAVSDAMASAVHTFGLDEDTAYAATAAALDMGLAIVARALTSSGAESLAAPWRATGLPG